MKSPPEDLKSPPEEAEKGPIKKRAAKGGRRSSKKDEEQAKDGKRKRDDDDEIPIMEEMPPLPSPDTVNQSKKARKDEAVATSGTTELKALTAVFKSKKTPAKKAPAKKKAGAKKEAAPAKPKAVKVKKSPKVKRDPAQYEYLQAKTDTTFQQRVVMLKAHVEKYGKCDLTPALMAGDTPDPLLKSFIMESRKQHKKFQRGEHSTLTTAKIAEMEALGFDFNPTASGKTASNHQVRFQAQWDEQYEKLKEYKAKHGDCLVSCVDKSEDSKKVSGLDRRVGYELKWIPQHTSCLNFVVSLRFIQFSSAW